MKRRLVFTWEWGSGNGHLRRFLPIAESLSDAGCEVILIVNDHERAYSMYAGTSVTVLPAPSLGVNKQNLLHDPQTFAGLAWNLGANDSCRIGQCVASWKMLFESIRPTNVISDFGLISGYVAKAMDIPLARIGLGFGTPPQHAILHGMFGSTPSNQELQYADRILQSFQSQASANHLKQPYDWNDLFSETELTLLVTIAEFDPYYQKRPSDCQYLGAWSTDTGVKPHWQSNSGIRTLGYLRSTPHLTATCQSLVDAGLNLCVACDGHLPKELQQVPNVSVATDLLKTGLEDNPYDLIVCNANHGLALRALELERPVLMFPLYIEHRWNASVVERLGRGLTLSRTPIQQWRESIQALTRKFDTYQSSLDFAGNLRRLNDCSLSVAIDSLTHWIRGTS
jgi:UDP:flavonoid glycosyltransferase YjiC (YdhE family)